MQEYVRRLFVMTAILLAAGNAKAQNEMQKMAKLGRPYTTRYAPQDYQAHLENYAISQDDQGIIYVGNKAGILQYDGTYWRLIKTPSEAGIYSLAKDSHGRIYAGGGGDVGYIEPGPRHSMVFHSLLHHLDSAHRDFGDIWFTYSLQDTVYFLTNTHVLRWAGNQFKVWTEVRAAGYASVVRGKLYAGVDLGSKRGLGTFVGDSIEIVAAMDRIYNLAGLLPYGEAGLMVINGMGSMYKIDKPGDELESAHKQLDGSVYNMASLPHGDYALGTLNAGVYIIDSTGTVKRQFKKEDGLSSNMVINVFADADHGLWMATDNGITRMELGSPVSELDRGLVDDVNDMAWFDHSLYVASNSGLIQLTGDGGQMSARSVDGLDFTTYSCEVIGNEMLVTNLDGIYVVKSGNKFEQVTETNVRALTYTPTNPDRIFFGLYQGQIGSLVKTNGHWREEDFKIDIAGIPLRLVEDTEGNIFISTVQSGVFQIRWDERKAPHALTDRYTLIHYDTTCGLPSMDMGSISRVNDSIYVSITGKGLYCYDDASGSFSLDSTLHHAIAYADIDVRRAHPAASAGGYWFTATHAYKTHLFKYENSALREHTVAARFSEVSIRKILDAGDVALLGSNHGIIAYNYRQPFETGTAFKTLIRAVIMNRDSSLYQGHLEDGGLASWTIAYAANNLRFQFSLPGYDGLSKNQYQYRLEGFDEAWSAWSAESQVDFTNLREGDYIFHVRGKDIYGQIGEEDRFSFTIRPPWYRATLAYGAYVLLLAGLIAAVVTWRSRRLKQEKAVLENLVAERTARVSEQAEKLSQQTEKLKEMDQIKSNFFANISHEFRTPLTLIQGPVQQWLRGSGQALTRQEGEMIYRNSDRLLQLVNQLLDLSKIDAGNLEVKNKAADVHAFLRAVTSSFTSLAGHKGVEYMVSITAPHPFACFDRDKLEKIIYNLLSNAFKFTPQGGTVNFNAVFEHAQLRIDVADTGEGIDSKDLPYIFDRFYQAGERSGGGTGVGLALLKEMVSLLEGTISVESVSGRGSRFIVLLPMAEATSTEADAPVTTRLPQPTLDIKKVADDDAVSDEVEQETILIVEDNVDMRAFIRSQLIRAYTVVLSADGKEGLTLARREVPDLIITDLMMPVMDGIAFSREIRKDERTSHIPVIMLTARGDRDSKLSGLETGADDYLTKPFDADELLARVHNLLAQRKELRRKFSQQVVLQHKDVFITSMDSRFLEKVEQTIEENLSIAEFGAAQLQDAMAMSKTQLQRKMKALTDQAPGEYLRIYRLKRAAQLLEKQSGNITEVAFATGFASQSYFTKAFRAYYGQTPTEYIKEKRAGH